LRRRLAGLLVLSLVFAHAAYAKGGQGGQKWTEESKRELGLLFDQVWQVAEQKGLVVGELQVRSLAEEKPKILTKESEGLCKNFSAFVWAGFRGGRITFCEKFLEGTSDKKRVIIAHELGHWQLGHHLGYFQYLGESIRDIRIRMECSASVFAAQVVGDDIAIASLTDSLENKLRKTTKKKVFELLTSPVVLPYQAATSLIKWKNVITNPLGQYQNRYVIHAIAFGRAVLVIQGKLPGCDGKRTKF